ncbi:MAG: DUF1559 domain-containing protein, partial [Fibrella sp.]|nr:DUF1559 domain-containing protein [Armatimonadota bacterium]
LFPVFAQAREKARQTACLSNLKQMGNALTMYAQDFDETLPSWIGWYTCTAGVPVADQVTACGPNTAAFRLTTTWDVVLQPYVKSGNPGAPGVEGRFGGIWRCPNNETDFVNARSYGFSMGLAYAGLPRPTANRYYRAMPLANIDSPASTVFVGEGSSTSIGDGRIGLAIDLQGYYEMYITKTGKKVGFTRDSPWRHQDGANYVWTDGHAKYMKGDDIYAHPPTPVFPGNGAQQAGSYCATAKYFVAEKTERDYWGNRARTNGNTTCSW